MVNCTSANHRSATRFQHLPVVVSIEDAELVLGIDEDTHLDVRLSFLKRRNGPRTSYVVSSWVKTHNWMGRLYMLPVAPVHRLLVKLMMRGVPM